MYGLLVVFVFQKKILQGAVNSLNSDICKYLKLKECAKPFLLCKGAESMNSIRRTCLFPLLIGVALLSIAADEPPLKADRNSKSAKRLNQAEVEWTEAAKTQDRGKLAKLCSEEFLFTDDEGKVSSKTDYLETMSLHFKIVSYKLSELKTAIYRDTGIVNGRINLVYTSDGVSGEGDFRFTDTFVQRGEQWAAVASQSARILVEKP